MWDALRGALVTSSIERESREDVLDIAAAELALMRVVDRGDRSSRVSLHVVREVIHGSIQVWSDDLVILANGADSWAVRIAAVDAITGLARALRMERPTAVTSRSLLDGWTGDDVEVWTRGGRFRGSLVVASDHLELARTTVIPWEAVAVVHRRT